MTKKKPTNTAASVRARLLNVAKRGGEDFHYVLTRYALERLLVRLARSAHRDGFLLKGAMLFRAWSPTLHRPTKDLDLLGSGPPDLDRLATIFREISSVVVASMSRRMMSLALSSIGGRSPSWTTVRRWVARVIAT